MGAFVDWISGTELSIFFQINIWAISALQTVHILAFANVLASMLLLDLRILGVTAREVTLVEAARRYVPWLWGSLVFLAASGFFLIVAEPRRELLNISFQIKMLLLLIGIAATIWFQLTLRRRVAGWEEGAGRTTMRIFAVFTFLLWCTIAVLGRWIAYTIYPES